MKYVKFIYNPKAGDKTITDALDGLIEVYQANGLTLIPQRLMEGFDIKESLSDIDENCDHILLAGGDGTINTTVTEIVNAGLDIPIAVLPAGTANDFSKAINNNTDYIKVAQDIVNSKPIQFDLGKCNDKYFVNVFSSGMFSGVSQNIESELKNTFGKVSYYFAGIGEAMNMKDYHMKIKSDEFDFDGSVYLILVFNGRTAGNIDLAYKSKFDDGLLDVIIFESRPMGEIIPMFLDVRRSEHLDSVHEGIHHFKTAKLIIECNEDLATDVDGEAGPEYPVTVEVLHKKIKVLGVMRPEVLSN